MVALNFPSSPSVNDTYTEGPLTYIFNGTKWRTFSNDYSHNGLIVSSVDNITDIDLSFCNYFLLTLSEDTTIQFTNPPPSGFAQKFFIKIVIADTVSSITWPESVIWNGDVATLPALGDSDLYEITTSDNGTTYYIRQREDDFQPELEGWNISTKLYTETFYNLSAQETNPTGVKFKPDGTKMFVIGSTGDKVYQYSLSFPWVIQSATYDNISLDISTQDNNPTGLEISTDGTLLYIVGGQTNTIYRYGLPTAWTLTGASHDNNEFEVLEDNDPQAVRFKTDGSIMYVAGNETDSIHQYILAIKWDISSAIYVNIALDVSSQDTSIRDFVFKPDGSKLIMLGDFNNTLFNNTIYEYNLSTEWNLFTASYTDVAVDVTTQSNDPTGIAINDNGTDMYILNNTDNRVYRYILTS